MTIQTSKGSSCRHSASRDLNKHITKRYFARLLLLLLPLLIRYSFDDDPAVIIHWGKARRFHGFAGTQMEVVCYDRSGNIIISSEKTVIGPALYRAF